MLHIRPKMPSKSMFETVGARHFQTVVSKARVFPYKNTVGNSWQGLSDSNNNLNSILNIKKKFFLKPPYTFFPQQNASSFEGSDRSYTICKKQKYKDWSTPLMRSINAGKEKDALDFINKGANPDFVSSTGKTALSCAIETNSIRVLDKLILRSSKRILNLPNEEGYPPLFQIKKPEIPFKYTIMLLQNEANPFEKSSFGFNILHTKRNKQGEIMHRFSIDEHDALWQLLNKRYLNLLTFPNSEGHQPLHDIILDGDVALLDKIINNFDILPNITEKSTYYVCKSIMSHRITEIRKGIPVGETKYGEIIDLLFEHFTPKEKEDLTTMYRSPKDKIFIHNGSVNIPL